MNDPALRVVDKSFCADRKVSKASARALEKYENSRVVLPSIWGRKSLPHPKHLLASHPDYRNAIFYGSKLARADIYIARESTPFYPFCKELYRFATGEEKCDWIHCVSFSRLEAGTHTFSWPCGCTNPRIQDLDLLLTECKVSLPRSYTDAVVVPNLREESGWAKFTTPGIGYYPVPRNNVFREASSTKKGKKRKPLSLTDHKSYRRLLRSKRTASCSSALLGEDSDRDE